MRTKKEIAAAIENEEIDLYKLFKEALGYYPEDTEEEINLFYLLQDERSGELSFYPQGFDCKGNASWVGTFCDQNAHEIVGCITADEIISATPGEWAEILEVEEHEN